VISDKLYREQINNLTPFLDAGIVYGSTESEAKELRLFSGGKLRSGSDGILPVKPTGSQCGIPPSSPVQSCFLAGESSRYQSGGTSLVVPVWW